MKATTIKIENPLLKDIETILPEEKSLSAFVREILEKEVRRQKMITAGEAYALFLESSPEEGVWLKDWESSDLATVPKPKLS